MIGLGNSVVKRKLGGGPPAAPVNVSQPFLVGTGEVGTVVTCNRGSWSGSPSPTYTYDFRIDSISVQNTSSNSYTPVIADNGKTLTCLVTATNPLGSASEGTSNSKIIGTAPTNTVLPTIDVTGNQVIGTVLTATDGTWTGSTPITYQYRWTRNGVAITGATTNTYTLQAADESATIRVQVRGVNSYATSAYVTSDDSVVGGYAPVNTGLPSMSLSGNQLVGTLVTVTDGTWTGTPTITYQYRWLRNGSPIGGATTNSYTLQSADDGATITAEVRGVNSWGTSAYSTSNNSINAGSVPVNAVAPTVSPSGTQSTGTVITANVGTWDGTPTITYAYRWTRNGSPISGATASTYTIQVADDGTTIRCEVQGSNAFGTSAYVASSNSVSAVNAIAPVNVNPPQITGTAVVGQTLSSTTGTWTGIPTPTYSYQWRRNGVDIGSATSSTYTLVQADAGNTSNITCVVTATNAAGSANATSNTIAVIYDAMAWDYRQRVITAGGTMSLSRLELLQGTVIIPNKTLLEKLNFGAGVNKGALHIYTAENATQALTNILNSNFTATTINSPTFTANSFYTGGSGIAINSNWNASTLSLGTNNIMIAAAFNNNGGSVPINIFGMESRPSPLQNSVYTYTGAASFVGRMLTANERSVSVPDNRIGWHSMRRLNNDIIWNGNVSQSTFTDTATGTYANLTFYDLALNSATSGITAGSNRQQCYAIKGAYITDSEVTTLRTALRNYCLAINPALVI
jgi:hypothetical protein